MVSLQALALVLALSGAGDTALLDFYSDSCGPCRQMFPVVERLAAAGYPVRKVNVDREPQLAARFGINRIPCFVVVVNGKETDRLLGATSYDRLEAMCKLALARRPAPASTPTQPAAPPIQLASGTPTTGGMTMPAVHSEPAFSAGAVVPAVNKTTAPAYAMAEPGRQAASAPGPSDADLLAATVRLRIEDSTGQSCGTGTIIDARQGEALILTCGHLFRESQGKGKVEVDLYGAQSARAVPGRVIGYNLDRDVALLSIHTPGPVAVARVAPPGYQLKKGAAVATVGCSNGDDPTVRHSRITSMDKFVGPPNVQVAGQPVQGRSGGGLFSREGYVIGVCNAADPADNEGLFAAPACIYAQLDAANLASIYRSGGESAGALVAAAPPPMPKSMPQPDSLLQPTAASTREPAAMESLAVAPAAAETGSQQQPLRPEEQAALDQIRRSQAEGAEVIFVIRSRSNPESPSKVFVLDKASPAFVEQLAAERRSRAERQPTSLEIPRSANASDTKRELVPVPPRTQPAAAPVARSNWQPRWLDAK